MNVLLLGSGGREHALAWKLAQSPHMERFYAAPGNPGIAEHAELVDLDILDGEAIASFARANRIGLVVVGPEAPLVAGVSDAVRARGISVFGPTRRAAQLEGSKGFTKDLCQRHGIPTGDYVRVTARDEADAAVARFGAPVVIKADGLAAGKGVTVAMTLAEARTALDTLFADGSGEAVIEEYLEGEEVSLFAVTDGTSILPFGSAQDHKRVGDGDTGPNTGGMGAYSPASVLTPALEEQAFATIIRPTVAAMRAEGTAFSGVLFAGLMLTAAGPKLIEYNARFGDPECEVLMSRFEGDLLQLMIATAQNRLAGYGAARFSDETALTVVMAAENYPGTPRTGGAIAGLDAAEALGARVFQAGTKRDGDSLVAAGGRVLAVTASGSSVAEAQAAAYRAVDALDFPTGFCRRDIGWREVARETADA